MKNIRLMLCSGILLTVFLILGTSNHLLAQNEGTPKLTSFLILVETTDEGIRLTGLDGCAWKELTFTSKKYNPQAIDQYGMTSITKSKLTGESNLPTFLFTIKKTNDGLSFEGLQGTAWINLSFSCPDSKCHQLIDQNGMVSRD